MKVFVTGGTGFLGSWWLRHWGNRSPLGLLVRGDLSSARKKIPSECAELYPYSGKTEEVLGALEDFSPNTVIHLATHYVAEHRPADIEPLISANLLLGTQVLEGMRHVGCKRFLNLGTAWQHFQNQTYSPVCLYAATKQAFEDICYFYHQAHSFHVTHLKLFDTYGPEDPRPKLIPMLFRAAAEGLTLDFPPGDQKLDLVHIEDVLSAIATACTLLQTEGPPRWESYCVSSGSRWSLREIVEIFEKATDRRVAIRWGARAYRSREVMDPWDKGASLPEWAPQRHLAEALAEMALKEKT